MWPQRFTADAAPLSLLALEIAANAAATLSVVLAARNSVHTWWTGLVGCVLFALLFSQTQLYADVTLQLFFIASSLTGWWRWLHQDAYPVSDIQAARGRTLWLAAVTALLAALAYGALLSAMTDAYAPFADSLVLSLSVAAQILLVKRRTETWWFWIAVDLVAVPLYASRGLYLTSAVYAAYLINAVWSLQHWRQLEKSNLPTGSAT